MNSDLILDMLDVSIIVFAYLKFGFALYLKYKFKNHSVATSIELFGFKIQQSKKIQI